WSFIPALLAAMIVCPILAIIIEKIAYKPLRSAPRIAALTTAIGVSLLLQNLVRAFIGPNYLPFPELIKRKSYVLYSTGIGSSLRTLNISNIQIIVLSVSLGLMFILNFIVRRTKIGKAMRAVSFDKDAARLMGINVDQIITITFAIGSSLAGAAGVLVGIAYPRIDPYMGVLAGLKAFVAAVLGGIGIIPGAMFGGQVMGIAETMVVAFGKSTYRDAIAFTILILILLFKPAGLFGKSISEKV
ncbi:MAG: branched-chain amino acid ABC transporter permease, partial [bacterium]|nr:branched-chain amino acid ABC transporter permease [bacterium]